MRKKLLEVHGLNDGTVGVVDNNSFIGIDKESDKDIAVIGIAGRFPKSEDIDSFWNNIINKTDCVGPLSAARKKDIDDYLNFRDGLFTQRKYEEGAFLEEIDKFDYNFFRLSPREAQLMNPNQRLFLETAWGAIEDAGYGGRKLVSSKTGVFVGYIGDLDGYKYRQMILDMDQSLGPISVVGNLPSIIASRISYLLDLNGPSVLVDTACSSSLVAIHLACKSLRNKECDMAIAGSVRTILLPSGDYDKIGIEAADGRAKTFDESSDGTGVGEGSGVVVLKPLSKALKDGDNIYAVIKGSAINQDGSSAGISAPNMLAQESVILSAWEDAGINPETISYIEAHGTGTKLGDPIEINAIDKAFKRYTDKKQFCAIGSVKTNIGHLYDAAGIAGFLKCVLALKHKMLPPMLHFNNPNSKINFKESPVYVNIKPREWKANGIPRRCGISAFGFSGTNCHMILEEAPDIRRESCNENKIQVFKLSAKSKEALRKLILSYRKFVSENKDIDLADICYTANTGRGCYNYRLAMIIKDRKDFEEKLEKLSKSSELDGLNEEGIFYGKYIIVPDEKEVKKEGELTEGERSDISKKAAAVINSLLKKEYSWESIADLCWLYVKGSDIDWGELYSHEKRNKVRLPIYPFDRNRCWLEVPKTGEVPGTVEKVREKPEKAKDDKKDVEVRLTGRESEVSYTAMEKVIGSIWAEVLGFNEISIHEGFYEAGGDSIAVMQVIAKIAEKTGKNLKLSDFMDNDTIMKLALFFV